MHKPLPATQEHVYRLEESNDRFVADVGVEFNKLHNLQTRSEAEMRAYKEENRAERREINRK